MLKKQSKWLKRLIIKKNVMDTITATDAKKAFGDVVMKAQKEPVWINKHGKNVAVIMLGSDFADIQVLKAQVLKADIERGLNSIRNGRTHGEEEVFEELMELANA
jgi:prevent-host-death family protein